MAAGLATHKDLVSGTLEKMFDLYNEKVLSYLHFLSFRNNIIFHKQNMLPMPEFDDYGMIIPASLNKRDEWEARSGIADTLKSCSDILDEIADVINVIFTPNKIGSAINQYAIVTGIRNDIGIDSINIVQPKFTNNRSEIQVIKDPW